MWRFFILFCFFSVCGFVLCSFFAGGAVLRYRLFFLAANITFSCGIDCIACGFCAAGCVFLVFSLVAGLCVLLFGVRVEFQCKGMQLF